MLVLVLRVRLRPEENNVRVGGGEVRRVPAQLVEFIEDRDLDLGNGDDGRETERGYTVMGEARVVLRERRTEYVNGG